MDELDVVSSVLFVPPQSKQDMEQTPKDNKSQRSPALAYAIGLPLGAAIGVALWLTPRNPAIGIGVGLALGIAFRNSVQQGQEVMATPPNDHG